MTTPPRPLRATALAGLTLLAGQPTIAQPRYADGGTPGAAACEALGFHADRGRDVAYRGAPPSAAYAPRPTVPPLPAPPVERRLQEPRPPMAAPPPPPPPPGSAVISEMVVTAQKRAGAPSVAGGYIYQPPQRVAQDTERYPGGQANPIKEVAAEPVSTFSVDVDTAAYSNVRRFLNDGSRPPADAVRVEELVNYFDYGYARPADRASPFRAYVALAPSPWSQQRQILHIGLQGVGSSRVDLQACKLEYSIVSPK